MEKINKHFYNIAFVFFATFIFLWDFSILGLQFRSFILFLFLLILLDVKKNLENLFNYKLISNTTLKKLFLTAPSDAPAQQ